jgi:hypothetical protein
LSSPPFKARDGEEPVVKARIPLVMVVLAVAFAPACRRSRSTADAASSAAPVTDAGTEGIPSPAQLEAYVSGAGVVRLGMTESEVTKALGRRPSRRQDGQSPGASTDVAWDDLPGPRPGAALGRFVDDRLISIEFAPTAPVLPRLDYATADSVTQADYVRRSVARTLRMADIEAVTRVAGYRASWTIMSGFGSPTRVRSRWVWEVEPGNRVLYVEELDGLADQPVIRAKR